MAFGGHRRFDQEVSKPVHTGATLARLFAYVKPYWPALVVVAILIVAGTWIQVTIPELTGQAVDRFITPAVAQSARLQMPGLSGEQAAAVPADTWYARLPANPTTADYIRGLGQTVLVLVGLFVAGSLMGGLQSYIMNWAGQRVLRTLRVELFRHIHRLSLSYFSRNEAGSVMSRVTNDMDTLQMAINFALVQAASGALLLVWTVYRMLAHSVIYGLISMATLPLMLGVTLFISSRARRAFRHTRVAIGRVNVGLEESISGVREVQAFGREEANLEAFRASNAANRDANITAVGYTAALMPAMEALGYLSLAIVTIAGGLALLRGHDLFGMTMSLGLIITFLGYVQRFNQPIAQISTLWTNIQSAVAGAERIFGLLDTVPEVKDLPEAQPLPPIVGRVEFDRVDAHYNPGEPVLQGVSLVAEPGQTIAIVGPTGAGKTTMANLIPRFYDVAAGAVRIDGSDVRQVTLASLRRQIGLVLQDTFLFSDTVLNNIRFGRPEATDEEVKAAARLVHADDFVKRLPQGYDTVLGEQGAGLSQGQRQLVAIARAALADPRILILDEATSSVDTRTERQIQRALEGLLQGRTSFVIAHRLSTIRNADLVLVIEEGRIVERGRHAELLARQGAYYRLYMKQFRQEEGAEDGESLGPAPSPAPSPA